MAQRKVKICNIIEELVLLNNQNVELIKHGITITNKMLETIVNAFAPSEILKIVLDEETKKAEVVVSDEQLSQAIGRRGQNVRLASILTGWHIDVLNAEQEAENRQQEEKGRLDLFMQALDVDDMIAHLLIQEGFTKIEEIAFVELDELTAIEGFDEALATELQSRAATYLTAKKEEMKNKVDAYELADDLKNCEGMRLEILAALGEKGIKTLDDFADLAGDEVVEIVGKDVLSLDDANALIMKAREHWFDEETSEN